MHTGVNIPPQEKKSVSIPGIEMPHAIAGQIPYSFARWGFDGEIMPPGVGHLILRIVKSPPVQGGELILIGALIPDPCCRNGIFWCNWTSTCCGIDTTTNVQE